MHKNLEKTNRKLLQNWQYAVAMGLAPCGVCNPFYIQPDQPSAKREIGF